MSYLIIELETQLLKTGKTSADLIRATGHTPANISKLRNGKIKAIRLKTLLDICDELETPTLEEYGINKEEFFNVIDKMAADAMESGSPSNTRKAITAEDVKEIYKNLW